MPPISQLIPDPNDLLAMEPEELAPLVLRDVLTRLRSDDGNAPHIKRGNYFTEESTPANGYPDRQRQRVDEALMAAWMWLEREGFFLPAPHLQDRDWVIVSERGKAMLNSEQSETYKYLRLLPRESLHPAIAVSTFALFARGHYDTVVFEAFRAVEVAVREASGLPQEMVGVALMREAFDLRSGPLTDMLQVKGEQQAMSDFFAGAMGLFKNPTSHRANTVTTPEAAASLVMLADYLLKMVDERRGRPMSTIGR
jgi:uncharacterized protein (TIGR02391 family)